MPMILGYWGPRGLTAPIRYLLEYVGEKYEFKEYDPENREAWLQEKPNLGLQFPNLPYLMDGDVKLSQSGAIFRYLGRKHNLVARSEKDQQLQDILDGVTQDLRMFWAMLLYIAPSQDFEKDKNEYREQRLIPILKQLEQTLSGKQYLMGDNLNYNDFILFEILDINEALLPGLLGALPNLKKYHERIGNLKGVKEFRKSDRFPKKINGPTARWGG